MRISDWSSDVCSSDLGADAEELDELTLPSEMNARRPDWMIKENAAPSARLPVGLRRSLARFRAAHNALETIRPERNAWDFDLQVAYDYIPGIEECSSLPRSAQLRLGEARASTRPTR